MVKGDELVVAKQQVEVLEGFCKEKALLHIVLCRFVAVNILEARVAAIDSAVLLKRLDGFPSPLTVTWFVCESPQDKVRFDHFRSKDVVLFI